MNPDFEIQIFAKVPEAGKAKTRLIPAIGEQGAQAIALQLLRHTVEKVARDNWDGTLWCTPNCTHPEFVRLQQQYGIPLQLQQGTDLGERMLHAARQTLSRGRQPIIIGTDCPALDRDYLMEVCEQLNRGVEVVLGPAEDGGYVMIALSRVDARLFSGVAWGSGQVLDQTRQRIVQLGWSHHEMRVLWDVDVPADLDRLQGELGDVGAL